MQDAQRLDGPVANLRRVVCKKRDDGLAVLGIADLGERRHGGLSHVGLGILECSHQRVGHDLPAQYADGLGGHGPEAALFVLHPRAQAPEDRGIHRGVGRDGRTVELVRERLEKPLHRATALAFGVDLHESPDRLLPDFRIAILQRRHQRRHSRQIPKLPQGQNHLEPHPRLRVSHERGERCHRRGPATLAERLGGPLSGLRRGALQVRDLVFEGVLRCGQHDAGRQIEGQDSRESTQRARTEHVISQRCHDRG